jgi:hypothetical protein
MGDSVAVPMWILNLSLFEHHVVFQTWTLNTDIFQMPVLNEIVLQIQNPVFEHHGIAILYSKWWIEHEV